MSAPTFVAPMKAMAVTRPPEGRDWTYEVKLDGYRCIAIKDTTHITLWSARGTTYTADYPSAVATLRTIKARRAVLDGEIVAIDGAGRTSFDLLQRRTHARPEQIRFYAFDLLHLNGDDLRHHPLEIRKQKLFEVTAGTEVPVLGPLKASIATIVATIAQLDLEGIVAKRIGSAYQAGHRSADWLKWQQKVQQEFVIGGFRPGNPLQLLLVGYYEGKKLVYAGKVRQKLNRYNRRELFAALEPLVVEQCPFANLPNSTSSHFGEAVTAEDMLSYRWVKPVIVCQVGVKGWTPGGNLRQPDFLGLRTDKDAREVTRDVARAPVAASLSGQKTRCVASGPRRPQRGKRSDAENL